MNIFWCQEALSNRKPVACSLGCHFWVLRGTKVSLSPSMKRLATASSAAQRRKCLREYSFYSSRWALTSEMYASYLPGQGSRRLLQMIFKHSWMNKYALLEAFGVSWVFSLHCWASLDKHIKRKHLMNCPGIRDSIAMFSCIISSLMDSRPKADFGWEVVFTIDQQMACFPSLLTKAWIKVVYSGNLHVHAMLHYESSQRPINPWVRTLQSGVRYPWPVYLFWHPESWWASNQRFWEVVVGGRPWLQKPRWIQFLRG